MDILTCSVGIMLIVVVVALLDVRGTSVNFHLPLATSPADDAARKIMLCKNSRVRLLDFDSAVEQLVNGVKVTYQNLPELVERANALGISDDFFEYNFEVSQWREGSATRRAVAMTISEKRGAQGYRLEDLQNDPTAFAALIEPLSQEPSWIAFSVDEASLAVFREARSICAGLGVSTGWDPFTISFPHEQIVLGGDTSRGPSSPRSTLSTKQTGG